MDPLIQETSSRMQKVLDLLKTDLNTIRTGRATPSLVDSIVVSVYGGSTRLKVMELATVTAQDNQTLLITPFDASIIEEIQKGIHEANVGFNPVVDTPVIRISIPPLSLERREELIHLMRQKLENGRIMVRQARQDAMNEVKKADDLSEDDEMHLEKEIQRVTDEFMKHIEMLGEQKEKELMQI